MPPPRRKSWGRPRARTPASTRRASRASTATKGPWPRPGPAPGAPWTILPWWRYIQACLPGWRISSSAGAPERNAMTLLSTIQGPEDVRRLPREQLPALAAEVRQRLVVVELTVALLASFDSPQDKIVWDVGHQGYPWKILTGRNAELPTLRQAGGLSPFLRRSESVHDIFGAGHAGTAMSAALGIATA